MRSGRGKWMRWGNEGGPNFLQRASASPTKRNRNNGKRKEEKPSERIRQRQDFITSSFIFSSFYQSFFRTGHRENMHETADEERKWSEGRVIMTSGQRIRTSLRDYCLRWFWNYRKQSERKKKANEVISRSGTKMTVIRIYNYADAHSVKR